MLWGREWQVCVLWGRKEGQRQVRQEAVAGPWGECQEYGLFVKSEREAQEEGDNLDPAERVPPTVPLREDIAKAMGTMSPHKCWGPGVWPWRPYLHCGIAVPGTAALQAPYSAIVDTSVCEECLEESQWEKKHWVCILSSSGHRSASYPTSVSPRSHARSPELSSSRVTPPELSPLL